MAILLLLICFLAIFLIVGISSYSGPDKKEVLLLSVLIFSALLIIITELLSVFEVLNYRFILLSWGVVSIACVAFLIRKKDRVINFCTELNQQFGNTFRALKKSEKFLLYIIITMLGLIFIQGLVYPPNNYDSLNYHLARIPNWISNHSIAHFPTHIIYQIYHPPFAEYVVMHFNLLSGGDYFSNSVQFLFFIFSLVSILSIIQIVGLSGKYKIIAFVLGATIPEVLLQASSTQNDIVVSFFILTSVYFAIKITKESGLKYFLFFGLSSGIGILTKGTAYVYLAPLLLIFGIRIAPMLFMDLKQ